MSIIVSIIRMLHAALASEKLPFKPMKAVTATMSFPPGSPPTHILMAATSRSRRSRRRPARSSAAAPDTKPGRLLLKGNEVAAAGLLAAFTLLLVGIALLAPGGTGDGGAASGDGGATVSPSSPTTAATQPAGSDEQAIQRLARRSIEVLPAGQWPSLYDSFTSEFQQRCPREQFERVGKDAAIQLGNDLRLLRFKRTESVTSEGSSAQAVIVAEIAGKSEYQIQAAFQKEDGDWKIAPAPNTQGCDAFGRLTG
jgi:hypothetical protein